ncbi:AraC family transcriptional regulator [Stomatohabitans albus]|uniref:AraC family transcriptional regulator n=1 Tax=Stomatohabitans albus TaxID=3110766 RepID=UPI00300C23E0
MKWVTHFNTSIEHIEANLCGEISYEELARIAQCSSFHYQRMFAYLAGIPLGEYIRRRRMSLAATDLQHSDQTVLQIGLKYGYASPTAFNRAFQSVHGLSPSAARQQGAILTSYPPIHFTLTVKGVEKMNYRIEHKDAIRVVGRSVELSQRMEENGPIFRQAWEDAVSDGTLEKLSAMINAEPFACLGLTTMDGQSAKYWVAVPSTKEPTDGLEAFIVPALTYAVFEGKGVHDTMTQLFHDIMVDWLPNSGFDYAGGPDIEVYIEPDPETGRYEVWIPVAKAA